MFGFSSPFAISKNNPIKAVSIADGYYYLDHLRTIDGKPVRYERIGSMRGNGGGIIDAYVLHYEEAGKEQSVEVYIDSYAAENSTEAPEGLQIYNERVAIQKIKTMAERGVPDAMEELGYMYFNGKGVSQDDYEALKWFRKAAEHGVVESYFYLGIIYSEGKVVPQDYQEALKWYKMSAEHGEGAAESNIGRKRNYFAASAYALNFDEFKQTAEQEAQRIAMYLTREMRKVDRERDELVILFDGADQDRFTLARLYGKGTDTIKINNRTYYKEPPFELSSQ